MAAVTRGVQADAVEQRASVVVYVEGNTDSFDQAVIGALLSPLDVEVRTLGCCDNSRAAAAGWHASHPNYLFIADRDYRSNTAVEDSWSGFPDPEKWNLLFWRRHELESYFLEPAWLARGRYLKPRTNEKSIAKKLTDEAKRRLYLDVVNDVIAAVLAESQQTWVWPLPNPAEVPDEDSAWRALSGLASWTSWPDKMRQALSVTALRDRFDQTLADYLGGATSPVLGSGQWQARMSGKPLYHHLVDTCFAVRDLQERVVQGKDARGRVAIDLIQQSDEHWPADIRRLRDLVKQHREQLTW
ncbi:MAG: hypothetical protein IT204_12205 [Fimbriimonadaceae bacterium]|nr:hypothetical protein [Fimbriimonadaceae bacterium]